MIKKGTGGAGCNEILIDEKFGWIRGWIKYFILNIQLFYTFEVIPTQVTNEKNYSELHKNTLL